MDLENRLKGIASRSFYYGFGSIVGKMVGFIMLPIYTRYLTPSDYGVASFLVMYVTLVQLLFGARMEQGIIYFSHNTEHPLQKLWTTSVFLSVLTTLIPIGLSIYFSEHISLLLFATGEYSLPVKIISFNVLLSILETYGFLYLRITDRYKSYLGGTLLKLLTQLTANIILVVIMEKGVVGVAISSVIGTAVAILSTSIRPLSGMRISDFSRRIIKELFYYCYPLWLTGFIGLYIAFIPQFAISRLAGLADLGLYNLANNFGLLVGVLLWAPFFSYWQVERFKIYKQPNPEKVYRDLLYTMLAISLVFAFIISLLGKPIIEIMADSSFHNAYIIIFPLTIQVIAQYITWYLNFSFLISEHTNEILKNNIFKAIVTTVLAVILIPAYGFIGAAWSLASASVLTAHYCHYRGRRFYDMGISLLIIYGMLLMCVMIFLTYEWLAPTHISELTDIVMRGMTSILIGTLFLSFAYRFYKQIQRKGE